MKFRNTAGENNPMSRWTDDQLRMVLQLKDAGYTGEKMATTMGMKKSYVYQVSGGSLPRVKQIYRDHYGHYPWQKPKARY